MSDQRKMGSTRRKPHPSVIYFSIRGVNFSLRGRKWTCDGCGETGDHTLKALRHARTCPGRQRKRL